MCSVPLRQHTSTRRWTWLRLGAAVLLLGLVALGTRFVLGDALEPQAALALLRRVQGEVFALPIFLLAYVLLTSAFVPAGLFHLVAGAAWGFEAALVLNLVAFNVTSNLQFWVARRLGRRFVAERAGRLRLEKVERRLERDGFRAALLIRILPLPNLAVNLTAGVSALRWRDFALGSALGTLPIIAVYTFFAAALVEGVAGAKQQALIHSAIGALLVVALAVLSRVLAKRADAP